MQQLETCFRQVDGDLQHVANILDMEFEQRYERGCVSIAAACSFRRHASAVLT